jgi:hypothetical protein
LCNTAVLTWCQQLHSSDDEHDDEQETDEEEADDEEDDEDEGATNSTTATGRALTWDGATDESGIPVAGGVALVHPQRTPSQPDHHADQEGATDTKTVARNRHCAGVDVVPNAAGATKLGSSTAVYYCGVEENTKARQDFERLLEIGQAPVDTTRCRSGVETALMIAYTNQDAGDMEQDVRQSSHTPQEQQKGDRQKEEHDNSGGVPAGSAPLERDQKQPRRQEGQTARPEGHDKGIVYHLVEWYSNEQVRAINVRVRKDCTVGELATIATQKFRAHYPSLSSKHVGIVFRGLSIYVGSSCPTNWQSGRPHKDLVTAHIAEEDVPKKLFFVVDRRIMAETAREKKIAGEKDSHKTKDQAESPLNYGTDTEDTPAASPGAALPAVASQDKTQSFEKARMERVGGSQDVKPASHKEETEKERRPTQSRGARRRRKRSHRMCAGDVVPTQACYRRSIGAVTIQEPPGRTSHGKSQCESIAPIEQEEISQPGVEPRHAEGEGRFCGVCSFMIGGSAQECRVCLAKQPRRQHDRKRDSNIWDRKLAEAGIARKSSIDTARQAYHEAQQLEKPNERRGQGIKDSSRGFQESPEGS